MTRFFVSKALSVRPPPRPVSASTGAPVSAASTADDVVVLPIPISPMPTAPTPSRFACAANSMPMAIARSVSSSLIARSRAILPVP